MSTDTLLIEIGTEELPPTSAKKLSDTFTEYVSTQIREAGFTYANSQSFVTPRRLALSLSETSKQQADQNVERKGPAVAAAYDDNGEPTKAALGFAKSCGVDIKDLETLESDKGAYLYFKSTVAGKSLGEILPDIIEQGLHKLPIPKPMRWGDYEVEFVRPIHWVTVMYGSEILPCSIKNIPASNTTRGHRFHAPETINLQHAEQYLDCLKQAKVIADFSERKNVIEALLQDCANKQNAELVYSEALLEEVTNLVEWPTIIVGEFSPSFLDIPQEALVVTMQDAQRYFPMFSKKDGALLPSFITIANIESSHPETIKHGNERVIKPRFEDAGFFWNRDKQKTLEARREDLKGILFEKQLGSILDKSNRIAALSKILSSEVKVDVTHAVRAAELCKADLLTDMVNEFPKLQGIMGRYYAQHDNESPEVSQAIEEHYQPTQSGSALPSTTTGQIVALCDRIDTMVGIFATGKKPTGVKDPYALRRAALGVIRISIEGSVDFDLEKLLDSSAALLNEKLEASPAANEVFDFIFERLKGYFLDQGIEPDTFESVRMTRPSRLPDFADRIKAVQHFRTLPEANSLAAANKRIRNILKKASTINKKVDENLLIESAEKDLYKQVSDLEVAVKPKFIARKYNAALTDLAQLRPAIDKFFDDVMVMDEDEQIRNNRIALLAHVNKLFSTVADISLLQN